MSSDASWLVLERSSGQGEASLPFRVTPNDTPKARRGTVAIESTRLELAQDGAPCTFHLDNTHVDIDAGGAVVRIEVTAMSDCAWSARALESWISVTSGASASGTGVVGLSIAANSGPARQGSVMIADQTISVTQQAFGSPAPSPARRRVRRHRPGTTEPRTTGPGTTEPRTTGPGTTEPRTTGPGTTEPRTTGPGTTEPRTTGPGTTEPRTAGPGTTESRTTGPGTTGPGTTEPGPAEPGPAEPGPAEPGPAEPRSSGTC